MRLVAVDGYVDTVRTIVVTILLCTAEDPAAVHAFESNIPRNWTVLLDLFYVEYQPYRETDAFMNTSAGRTPYNVASNIATLLKGRPGLWAISSALVAAEAQHHVLTLQSNWSRLINELRQVVDMRLDRNPRWRTSMELCLTVESRKAKDTRKVEDIK